MSADDNPTTGLTGRKARGTKPAAVDIIRKKNLRELADDSAALRERLALLQSKNERLTNDMSTLEADLAALRSDVAKTKSA